jgi:thymidine phosphorylase
MLVLSGLEPAVEPARLSIQRVHESGAALECFRRNVEAQGGDPHVCDDPAGILPLTDKVIKVESPRPGFIIKVDTEEIGHAIAEAGGGRVRMEDQIDPAVGFLNEVKIGDRLRSGDLIGLVYCDDPHRGHRAAARVQAAFDIGEASPAELPVLIKEVIDK